MPALPSSLALTSVAPGAGVLSSPVRNNFADIQAAVNALTAALSGGTSGQVLTATGASSVAFASGSTTYRKSTSKTVNTTIAATDLFNAEFTLAANDLSTTRVARISAHGDYKNNSGGAADVPRFQLVLGGTTILDTNVPGVATPNVATRYGWWIEATIAETGATNTQSVSIRGQVTHGAVPGAGSAVFTTGEGTYQCPVAAIGLASFAGWNSGAKDGTGALTLVLNVINGSANANYETVLKDALVVIE